MSFSKGHCEILGLYALMRCYYMVEFKYWEKQSGIVYSLGTSTKSIKFSKKKNHEKYWIYPTYISENGQLQLGNFCF